MTASADVNPASASVAASSRSVTRSAAATAQPPLSAAAQSRPPIQPVSTVLGIPSAHKVRYSCSTLTSMMLQMQCLHRTVLDAMPTDNGFHD